MNLPEEIAEQFDHELQEFEKENKMTYITTMEQRGIEKGRQEGRQKGRQEGEQQEAAKTLLKILSKRFGGVSTATESKVSAASVEQLETWIDISLNRPTSSLPLTGHPYPTPLSTPLSQLPTPNSQLPPPTSSRF